MTAKVTPITAVMSFLTVDYLNLIFFVGLLIGLVLSWIMGLSGEDVFIWIFCLYFGLQVGQLIFSEDSKDDDDFGGSVLTPAFQGN